MSIEEPHKQIDRSDPLWVIRKQTLIDADVKQEIANNAEKPTDNCPVVGAFYLAVGEKVMRAERSAEKGRSYGEYGTDDRFVAALKEAVDTRLPFTSAQAMGKFIWPAWQYTTWKKLGYQDSPESPVLFSREPYYNKLVNPTEWKFELDANFSDPEFRNSWVHTMVTKNIPTTIPQRYAGIKAMVAHRFGDQPITFADIGCGMNWGLMKFELDEPFEEIDDQTGQLVTTWMNERVNLEGGIGIDIQDPSDPNTRLLSWACRLTPSEFWRMPIDLAQARRLEARSKRVKFRQGDFLTEDWMLPDRVKVIILSTILYQLTPKQREDLVLKAFSSLDPDGLLIAQEFAHLSVNPNDTIGLNFYQKWYGGRNYCTFEIPRLVLPNTAERFDLPGTPHEVLQWDGGRCKRVWLGPNGQDYFQDYLP